MLFELPFPYWRYYVFETEEQEVTIKGIQPLFASGN